MGYDFIRKIGFYFVRKRVLKNEFKNEITRLSKEKGFENWDTKDFTYEIRDSHDPYQNDQSGSLILSIRSPLYDGEKQSVLAFNKSSEDRDAIIGALSKLKIPESTSTSYFNGLPTFPSRGNEALRER